MAKRKPGQGEGTYIHPTTLDDAHVGRLQRVLRRDHQAHALVPDGKRWQVWCPVEDAARVKEFIEETEE